VDWELLYAELKNKIRWAISTTLDAHGVVIPYRASQEEAGALASTILERLKEEKFERTLPTLTRVAGENGSSAKNPALGKRGLKNA
jgi:hypothetical protein